MSTRAKTDQSVVHYELRSNAGTVVRSGRATVTDIIEQAETLVAKTGNPLNVYVEAFTDDTKQNSHGLSYLCYIWREW